MKNYDLTKRRPATEKGLAAPAGSLSAAAADGSALPAFLREIVTSVLATLFLAVIVSGVYPLVVYGIGQALFTHRANGSLMLAADGKTVLGSELLGQNFNGKQYFNPRPSAAGAAGYDATASGGTNLGPTSDKLINGQHKKDAAGQPVTDPANFDGIKDLVAAYRAANHLKDADAVPADAVTRSASGLDPHISIANGLLQLPRVARERGKPEAEVRQLMDHYTQGRDFGVLGEPRINTLLLNLALDGKLAPSGTSR